MDKHILVMEWSYHYDKEGTWFDTDEGEYGYELLPNTHFILPHLRNKRIVIADATREGEVITVTLKGEYRTFTVKNDGVAVTEQVSDDYMAAGDSVHQSLNVSFRILPKEDVTILPQE